ncbi:MULTISPECIES: hypothetical protein [Actinosynnema]|uniref:hypothetical protein n=1 Tax=Actinosynnema TaxID=40566 RepID=UPI0020A4B57C|nr:hypothetical protein [Actinosynnema pretiosum]MCP2097469.1 hypothetical protein [Actinosynnema pretiosum]
MPESHNPDIIDRIDALTDDAASWSATGEHTQSRWATPAPGAMTAVELAMNGVRPADISLTDPASDIVRLVGDPGVDRIVPLRRMQLWVGKDSATGPVNTGATTFLHRLLAAVRDGRYVAGDAERDHVRALLDTPDRLPVIHGPCLITGVGTEGSPASLDENFTSWFTGVLDGVAQLRQALAIAVVQELGIPSEAIDHIVVIPLD